LIGHFLVRQGEAGNGGPQLGGHFCQVTDRLRGSVGTGGSLGGDFLDNVHGVGNVRRRGRLLTGGVGDVLDQLRQGHGYVLDFLEGDTRVLGQSGTTDHLGGGVFHGDNRFVGIRLDGLNQCFNLLGCCRGTFRQALNFVRNHREAPARVTGHGGLDRRVQGQDVGLVGDVVDQGYDVTDFLGRLTQTLDPLGGFLDLLPDVVHAADGVLYHFRAFLRDRNRPLRNRRGFGGVRGYLVDGHSHLVNRSGGAGTLLGLVLGCFGQVHGRGLGFLGGGSYSYRSTTNRLYQSAHLVDRVVDGVGDGTGEVLGYCGLGGQVTIGQVGQFVQQSQDRVLVLFILLLGGGQTFLGVAVQGKTDKDNNRNHGGQDGKGQGRADQTGAGLGGEVVGQSRQFGQQTLGVLEDVTCGGTNLE